eukprot:scaffold25842_cov198-Amphora_coffeaeformis.AAC.24
MRSKALIRWMRCIKTLRRTNRWASKGTGAVTINSAKDDDDDDDDEVVEEEEDNVQEDVKEHSVRV